MTLPPRPIRHTAPVLFSLLFAAAFVWNSLPFCLPLPGPQANQAWADGLDKKPAGTPNPEIEETGPRPPVEVDPKLVEEPVRAVVSGKVVLLSEALARRDIKAYPDELRGQVVLETRDGGLLPIIPDWRGRALFQDKRLRDRPVDLLVRQRKSIPHLQVLSIYTFDEQGTRQLTDYWCDICSIPMYEIKDCECCQGPIRLRYQPKNLPADLAPPSGQSAPAQPAKPETSKPTK